MPATPARLVALLREHGRLLKKIGQKKRDLTKLGEGIRDLSQRLVVTQPVVEACIALDREVHALFAELLSRKRQPRGTRRVLRGLYLMLQDGGVLSPSDEPPEGFEDEDPEPLDRGGGRGDAGSAGERARAHADAGGFSARRPGDEPANQSLRGLFRDLATALHPDKVADEPEKARRTELMKEISRAYQDRDLERLLELKRIWMTGVAPAATGADASDETERRCANLERINTALRVQLRELTQQLKELRRSPHGEMLKGVRRSAAGTRDGASDPVADMIAETRAEREALRALRDCVLSYRDGTITLREFLHGPPSRRQREMFEGAEDAFGADREGARGFPGDPFDARGKRPRAPRRGASARQARP